MMVSLYLGIDGEQVRVLEQANQVCLVFLLQRHDGQALEMQISLKFLSNFSQQMLKGQLADEQVSKLLIMTDLSQIHSA